MLPFLEPKHMSTTIIARRGKPDLEASPEKDMTEDIDPGLKEAAEDLMRAVESKSVIDVAKALKSAFEICDAYPHQEGEHTNEEEGVPYATHTR